MTNFLGLEEGRKLYDGLFLGRKKSFGVTFSLIEGNYDTSSTENFNRLRQNRHLL